MAKVKIISNPYENSIAYEIWDRSAEQWTNSINANSKLHGDKMTRAVFPFCVKKILNVINEEFYSSSEKLELWFEGTADEYKDLLEVCTEVNYPNIVLHEMERCLQNARDILPQVKKIYEEKIQPLILMSVAENEDLIWAKRQFADVSKMAIPICVLGNYSSGKSSFINALIGAEILPSGDKPLTAKIHQLERSEYPDRASVSFQYRGEPVEIQFMDNNVPKISIFSESALISKLNYTLEQTKLKPLPVRINQLLDILNNVNDPQASELIKISFPFNRVGVFGQSSNTYVVFDTPGSNSASNTSHTDVLRKAMEDLSNGLPIYLTEFDKLDSNDNKDLCDMIKDMEKLDNRYTMIVVNKADTANLDGQINEEDVLSEVIPRNLYSSGIYFVSSIMALGAKTNGDLNNAHYRKIFKTGKNVYDDPTEEFYTTLYTFDILPEQIKKRSIEDSKKFGNRILSNSGLYWIEQEIETFASKYSPYNKCTQSILFLREALKITDREIEKNRQSCEHYQQITKEKLGQSEKELVEGLQAKHGELQSSACESFMDAMRPLMDTLHPNLTLDELSVEEEMITQKIKKQCDIAEKLEDKATVRTGDASDKSNWLDAVRVVRDLRSQQITQYQVGREIERRTSDALFDVVKERFSDDITDVQTQLNRESDQYWREKSEEIKCELVQMVTGSPVLSDEKKEMLTKTIMAYEIVSFDRQVDDIFIKDRFTITLNVFGWKWVLANKLDKRKLFKKYKSEFEKGVHSISERLRENHGRAFGNWNSELFSKIRENIIDFNPELRKYQQELEELEKKIRVLGNRREMLRQYTKAIEELMEWSSSEE